MAVQSLAIKYRPKTFDEVTEQGEIKTILSNQLKSNEVKNAYLFTGGAGTGKTTCARIFAKEINKGEGTPIELDAASNNSVDDVRDIISRAKTASINSEYKVFILDEVHMLSNSAWNAMLKLLEEPPMKSIFIMCTTDPQKIPKTILSRVQRYDFQRISTDGIKNRLKVILNREYKAFGCTACDEQMYDQSVGGHVCTHEGSGGYADKKECPFGKGYNINEEAIEYIAKLASGGMRDAITMLDKCLAYSTELTVDSVTNALGLADYDTMLSLCNALITKDSMSTLKIVDTIHMSGKDLKQFMRQVTNFVLDLVKYLQTKDISFTAIPQSYKAKLDALGNTASVSQFVDILSVLVKLNSEIKWDTSPKATIEATLILTMEDK